MIKALIFDYFGVVRPNGHGLRSVYRQLGGDVEKDETFIADITTAANAGFIDDMYQQLADHLGVSLKVWLAAVSAVNNNDQDLLQYIKQLRSVRHVKTGLLSNASAGSLEVFFAPGEIERYFDAAMVSGDSGFFKPEAAFYRMMADQLGVEPEECVMVDDREEYCRGAEFVGMKSILYQNLNQFKTDLDALITR